VIILLYCINNIKDCKVEFYGNSGLGLALTRAIYRNRCYTERVTS